MSEKGKASQSLGVGPWSENEGLERKPAFGALFLFRAPDANEGAISMVDTKPRKTNRRDQQSVASVERLLYSRRQTAHALGGISIATVLRHENAGRLDKVRPAGSPNGAVFHRIEQVRKLAEGGTHSAEKSHRDNPLPKVPVPKSPKKKRRAADLKV